MHYINIPWADGVLKHASFSSVKFNSDFISNSLYEVINIKMFIFPFRLEIKQRIL